MKTKCPLCETLTITSKDTIEYVSAPFGEPEPYSVRTDHCSECGEEGDFSERFPTEYSDALRSSGADSVLPILEYLEKNDVSNIRLQLAFSLPRGTIDLWKRGEISRAELALLHSIRAMPSLVDLAENGFKP